MNNEFDNPWIIIYTLMELAMGLAILKLIIESVLTNPLEALKTVLIFVVPLYLLNFVGYGYYTLHIGTFLLLFLVRSAKKEDEERAARKGEEVPPQDCP